MQNKRFRIPSEELKHHKDEDKENNKAGFRIPSEELKLSSFGVVSLEFLSFRIPSEELKPSPLPIFTDTAPSF